MAGYRKPGRPPILVWDAKTEKQLKELAEMQSTMKEAAAVLGVTAPSLSVWFGKCPEARECWDLGREAGKPSLRRLQWTSAKKGNVSMQIWLGKNWLGQTDKQEITQDITVSENDSVSALEAKIDAIADRRAVKSTQGNGSDTRH